MNPETRWRRFLSVLYNIAPRWWQVRLLRRAVREGIMDRGDYECLWCSPYATTELTACCSGCSCCWPIGRCHGVMRSRASSSSDRGVR